MENKITIAIYKFSFQAFCIEEYPIINETEKSYMIEARNNYNRKHRIPKEEVGKVIYHGTDNFPYVRVFLFNVTEVEARERIAEWFENKANGIRAGEWR